MPLFRSRKARKNPRPTLPQRPIDGPAVGANVNSDLARSLQSSIRPRNPIHGKDTRYGTRHGGQY